jgi:hypothetical protein
MQLSGADPDGDVLTYGANGLPPGLSIAVSTGLIAGTPTNVGVYPVTVTVSDGMQTATRTFTWTVTAGPDTVKPLVTITSPTTAVTFSTSAARLSLGGTASDNLGVTQVTWSNSRGGGGTATGTPNWSASVALQTGSNVLTITARDAAGNTATDAITVTYSTAVDTVRPTVTITEPTSSNSYTTTAKSIALSGAATDNVGVTRVTWANSRGGTGTATGTSSWNVASIALLAGSNVITVTSRDAAGNTATDTITVTYSTADTVKPVINIINPALASLTSTATSLTVSGTASDNIGVKQVTWRNSLGGDGVTTGIASWSASVKLWVGTNVITFTARDAAGNTIAKSITVTKR